MTTRRLISEDAVARVYEVRNDDGEVVGRDEELKLGPEQVTEQTIRDSGRQALTANRTFIALTSPTAAQTTAQVKALSRQMNGVIRLLLGAFDGTD
jgi:hypothetical protein